MNKIKLRKIILILFYLFHIFKRINFKNENFSFLLLFLLF